MKERKIINIGRGYGLIPLGRFLARVVDISKGPLITYETNGYEVYPCVENGYVGVNWLRGEVVFGEEFLSPEQIDKIQKMAGS